MGTVKENILVLSGQALEEQLKNQLEFLTLVHPFLKEKQFHDECMEIRAIDRVSHVVRSLNLWRVDEKGIEYYRRFLQKINGTPACLYYSIFSFDPRKECYKEDGTRYSKKCINNQNAEYTQILAADFDNVTEEEFKEYMETLKKLDIETINIFTGHGYQSIILLSHRVYNKNILKEFTELLIKKGFRVDETIADPARIMRMPFSFNCKAYDKNLKYYSSNPQPIRTEILNLTQRRYNVEDIFFLINSLPDVQADKLKHQPQKDEAVKIAGIKVNVPDNWDITEIYPMLKGYEDKLPQAVRNMLYQTREGYRNKVLLFIIPFFRNYLRLEIFTIKNIMSIWATRCFPALDPGFVRNEVERLLTYKFDGNYGKYDESMKQEFGPLPIIEEKEQYILNSGKMIIPNYIFSLYSSLSDSAIRLYFVLKTQEHLSTRKEWEIEEILEFAKISKATFHRNIKELIESGLIQKNHGNRRAKEKTVYFLCKDLPMQSGFTLFDVGTIENMIYNSQKKLTDGEFKLFTYLYYRTGDKGETWLSQSEIAEAIGKKRNSVSEMTDRLHEKQYIIKETYLGEDNKPHSRYILNYGYNYKPPLLSFYNR